VENYFIIFCMHAFLEGEFEVDLLHVGLVLMPNFCCTPSLGDFLYNLTTIFL
jgi:hypothetical protein